MDKLIIQELIEDIQLLYKELVEGVDDCTHNSDSMSLDRVEHLVDTNGLDLLRLGCDLNKDLSMDVIAVFAHKFTQVSQELQDIDPLLQLLSWQVTLDDVHLELLLCKNSHMFISLEIMRCKCRHLIEDLTEVMLYLFFDTYLFLKQIEVRHH